VLTKIICKSVLGVSKCVVEDLYLCDDGLVAELRLHKRELRRCGICGRRSPWYDNGEGRRWWRGLDWGLTRIYLEADSPRVQCPTHGVVVAKVPWARHGSRFTVAFEDTVAWQVVESSKTAVAKLMRVAWETVSGIAERVVAQGQAARDPFEGLLRIGIDEISHRRGHRYITLVYDHDSNRLVWAAPGRTEATLAQFFELLGPERCREITHVSADGAAWIAQAVSNYCPQAVLCLDPFHVVQWAGVALDVARREAWNTARQQRPGQVVKSHKGDRWILNRNPANLTPRQQTKLSQIAQDNEPVYRAYLLKEQLREVFHQPTVAAGMELLDDWILWARRCQISSYVELARKVTSHRDGIEAALTHRLSNARVEGLNTRIRLLIRRAFGFRSPGALISVALLCFGGYCPPLPGRS